jgi:hypothetical protein
MNLYSVTSPAIGNQVLIVKADDTKEAALVARDVIEENRMTDEDAYTLSITELVEPEDGGAGYCYPKNSTQTIRV